MLGRLRQVAVVICSHSETNVRKISNTTRRLHRAGDLLASRIEFDSKRIGEKSFLRASVHGSRRYRSAGGRYLYPQVEEN